MGGKINLAGGFAEFWSLVERLIPGIGTFMTVIGIAILVWTLIAYFWKKARNKGGQGEGKKIAWSMLVGGLLVAPKVILPVLLKLIDAILNSAVLPLITWITTKF